MKLTEEAVAKLETIIRPLEKLDKNSTNDPIRLVYNYKKEDQELVGFITSTLSYGKQTSFIPVIQKLLKLLGDSPKECLLNSPIDIDNIYYRFNKAEDFYLLFSSLKTLYNNSSLEDIFNYKEGTTKQRLAYLQKEIYKAAPYTTKGFEYLVPNPEDGSACKRMNMFLRWMIRKDNVDLGLWANTDKRNLIIPLDTHIFRISKNLNITTYKNPNWKAAEDITESLAYLDPEDPIKYDFILCNSGIKGLI